MLQTMRSAAKYIWWFVVLTFVLVFVFAETSGLTSRPVTRGTSVATVNGTDITYDAWLRNSEGRVKEAQQQSPTPLTLDEEERIRDQTFNEMVNEILLEQEYARRGITVTDAEIRAAALMYPHPDLMQNPEFQTDGQFDIEKYRRFLNSPIARQQGVLEQLEGYYRSEIPKRKLFEQIATSVYVPDAQLWRIWQDAHDSAQITYVRLDPSTIPDSAVHVSEQEIQTYFNAHKAQFGTIPGRAVVTVTEIPRTITAADSATARTRVEQLRSEIVKGAKFEDVARRESADSASAAQGGELGWIKKGQTVKPFEDEAFSIKPGELSPPVLSPFGYHVLEVEARTGDSVKVKHILIRIQQSDSSAAVTDRQADQLAKAGSSDKPALFDSLVKQLHLDVGRAVAVEGEPLTWNGRYVPSVSAWAFSGVKPGETSDLIDAPEGYFMARLDSLRPGGPATVDLARDEIRRELVQQKKVDLLMPKAQQIASTVSSGKTLEQAARDAGVSAKQSTMFTRATPGPDLGGASEAVGAAFGLPVGATSEPVKTQSAVFVLRVDRRLNADRAAWEKQKTAQREQVLQRLRQQRVQEFVASLRESAKVVDRRKTVLQQNQQAPS